MLWDFNAELKGYGVAGRKKLDLKREHRKSTRQLAVLNRDLAAKMILLASQTGDTSPLIQAVDALQKADELFSTESTPRELVEIRQALAETLHMLGKTQDDVEALEKSIESYRSAITLASLLGDDKMRNDLKKNYAKARDLLAKKSPNVSVLGAA